jgi:hypothetical protein
MLCRKIACGLPCRKRGIYDWVNVGEISAHDKRHRPPKQVSADNHRLVKQKKTEPNTEILD